METDIIHLSLQCKNILHEQKMNIIIFFVTILNK